MTDQDTHQEHLALTLACLTLFDHWGVDHQQQTILLGLEEQVSSRMMQRHEMTPVPFPAECMPRVKALLTLSRSIEAMLPHNPDAAHAWITSPNPAFSGSVPLDILLRRGLDGIEIIQQRLDGTSAWG